MEDNAVLQFPSAFGDKTQETIVPFSSVRATLNGLSELQSSPFVKTTSH